MKNFLILFLVLSMGFSNIIAQESLSYQKPSKKIIELIDVEVAVPTGPTISVSNNNFGTYTMQSTCYFNALKG